MKKSYIYLLTLFLLINLTLILYSTENLYFDKLMPRINNSTYPIIHSILQDRYGYIWITTPYGLIRYDGRKYVLFEHDKNNPGSVASNMLFSMLEDKDKNLWITSDNGLILFNRDEGNFKNFILMKTKKIILIKTNLEVFVLIK